MAGNEPVKTNGKYAPWLVAVVAVACLMSAMVRGHYSSVSKIAVNTERIGVFIEDITSLRADVIGIKAEMQQQTRLLERIAARLSVSTAQQAKEIEP